MLLNFKTQLVQKTKLTTDVFLFRFVLVDPKEISFRPGQYLILKFGSNNRLYSISSPNYIKNNFELLVEIISGGAASTYFSNLKIGNEVLFRGPAGAFILKEDQLLVNARDKIFLATGTGIAPIRSMILSQKPEIPTSSLDYRSGLRGASKNQKFYLFWGLRTYQDVYFFEELKQLNNETMGQFKFTICLSRESNLDQIKKEDQKHFVLGRINVGWEKFIQGLIINQQQNNLTVNKLINIFNYYLCGSREVIESLKEYLYQKGVSKENVFFEKF